MKKNGSRPQYNTILVLTTKGVDRYGTTEQDPPMFGSGEHYHKFCWALSSDDAQSVSIWKKLQLL